MHMRSNRPRRHGVDPWFRRRPQWAVAIAGALFAGVFAARLLIGDLAGVEAYLYVFPVALLAVAFGRWAGTAAGVVATALASMSIGPSAVDHAPTTWAARAVAVVLVGLVLGDASDRLVVAQRLRIDAAMAAERHRQGVVINDGLVQGVAAAKWLLEAGRDTAALETLDETLRVGQRLVSDLIRDAGGRMTTTWR
jgi:hypothetical protein